MAVCHDCWWCHDTGYSYWEPPEQYCEKNSDAWDEVDSCDEEIVCDDFLSIDKMMTCHEQMNDPGLQIDVAYDEWYDRLLEEETK